MSQIEQVPAVLTIIEDGTEYIVQASKATGKRLGALVLAQLSGATRITFMDETGVKVFKSNGKGNDVASHNDSQVSRPAPAEVRPAPASKRILQDEAAPPSPEIVEEDYEAELKRQEAEALELSRQEQFNARQDVQVAEEPPPEEPRKRTRNLSVSGSPCGRCAGSGQVVGETGISGGCPVCQGKGQIQSWGRGRRK